MRWPDFLVIGAAKAGTTSLHHYLDQHPDVFMSEVKEPGFFAFEGDPLDYRGPGDDWMHATVRRSIDDYARLFEGVAATQKAGEVSPVYLYDERAPDRIKQYARDVRLIAILRNPVDRAFSQFRFMLQCGREPLWSFPEALEAEADRIRAHWEWGWHYVQLGFYRVQLERYFDRFSRTQVKVVLYDDLIDDPAALVRDVFDFVGVDSRFEPDIRVHHNVTHVTRAKKLTRFLDATRTRKLARMLTSRGMRQRVEETAFLSSEAGGVGEIDPESAQLLRGIYADEIEGLQELIDRDLSHWLGRVS